MTLLTQPTPALSDEPYKTFCKLFTEIIDMTQVSPIFAYNYQMSTTLQISNLTKTFNKLLFEKVNISLVGPIKIGLIGDNGCVWQSTLLKMLAGVETIETGSVIWSKNTQIRYLPQEIDDEIDSASGEKKIIKITQLFYGNYDALLLDEPDNHLET